MGPYRFLCVLMGPYAFNGFQCVLMGPYKSFIVLMDSNGSLWVPIVRYAALWILMGPYRSSCVFMRAYRSL